MYQSTHVAPEIKVSRSDYNAVLAFLVEGRDPATGRDNRPPTNLRKPFIVRPSLRRFIRRAV